MNKLILSILMAFGGIVWSQQPITAASWDANSAIVEISQNNAGEILKQDRPTVIKVYSTRCPPCQKLEPIFQQFANRFKGQYAFAALNSDGNQALLKQLNVSGLPTVLYYRNGKEVGRSVGMVTEAQMTSQLKTSFSQ